LFGFSKDLLFLSTKSENWNMSFYPQPNKYQCGPFALKYAFAMLGVFVDEKKIGTLAGSTWWAGTDEIGLARAARRFECRMKHFTSPRPDKAIKLLNQEMKKGVPCILSVKNWGHWLTVVNYSRGKYVVIDSEQDKVISIQTPVQLLKLWKYYDEKNDLTSYDGYAIYPKFKVYTRARFGLKEAKVVMYDKNEDLAASWDQYVNDLTSACKPRTVLTVNYITFSEFLRRNEKNLIKRVANWHGVPTYAELKKILNNMKFVADVYDFIIHPEDEKKALIDVASILMMYSCGKYGMDPVYQ
jgi:hypothetical protein